MASNLTNTSLIINGTQEITGVSTTLNQSNTELPTGKAIVDYLIEEGFWAPVILDRFQITDSLKSLSFVN